MPISKLQPNAIALLPLFYIGWSDAVLSPSEVKLIQQKIDASKSLHPTDKQQLLEWCNPKNPPSPELIKQWRKLLQQAASQNQHASSLGQLGLEMAKTQAHKQGEKEWLPKDIELLLEEFDTWLGKGAPPHHSTNNLITIPKDKKPAFPTIQLQALLDDSYGDLRKRVFKLLQDPVFKHEIIRDKETYRNQILHWCKALAQQGWGALSYPESCGGQLDIGSYAAVFETLGYHDLSLTVKFGVQFGLFGGSVMWLGTQHHHDTYLKKIGTLELAGCFAMTETGHGSNVRDLETTATYIPEKDGFIIHSPTLSSRKEYIGNALHGQMATVFAQLIVNGTRHGVHAFLVPLRDDAHHLLPGVFVEDCNYKLGLNGVDNGKIWFENVFIPKENLLNRYGDIDEQGNYQSPIKSTAKRFFTMLGTLVGGRVCVPRAGLSAAKSGLTIAIRYALHRRQFGKDNAPETLILDYPSHQRRLMPLLAKAYALDFALTYLTKRFANKTEADAREIETLAAGLKSYATWFTTACLQECREACGGKGYLAENRFADLKADSDIFTTFEGDNTVLMQLVAKGVLAEFKTSFGNGGFVSIARFLAGRLMTSIREKNMFATRNTNETHLQSADFHLQAFKYREQDLKISVGQRLRRAIKATGDSYQAFLQCQNHLIELAKAHVETIVLEQFQATIQTCKQPELLPVLENLCDLYALHTIETHKGWYLEQGYLDGSKTKAIRRMVDQLCAKVRANAGELVNAFGIPDYCLDAPIANYN